MRRRFFSYDVQRILPPTSSSERYRPEAVSQGVREILLKEADAGNPDCSRSQDTGNVIHMDTAESEYRGCNGRTNTCEGSKAHRLAVTHLGRSGENGSHQEIVDSSLRSQSGLAQGVCRYSEKKAAGQMCPYVGGQYAGGRQMHPVRPRSECDVDTPVHQDPAGSISGKSDRFTGQVEKLPAGHVSFTKLNEIRPPAHCPLNVQEKRPDGRVRQLMAIRDVIEEWPPNGQ